MDALIAKAMAADADTIADMQAMEAAGDKKCPENCDGFDCHTKGLKSAAVLDLFNCMKKACGCTGSIYKFGFAMLFGMIAYWFK